MGSISANVVAKLKAAKNQTIYNVTSPGTPFTEFSQALSAGTKILLIRVRDKPGAVLRYTFTSGESNTKYITIPRDNSRHLSFIDLDAGSTLYMSCSKASAIIEIEEWV